MKCRRAMLFFNEHVRIFSTHIFLFSVRMNFSPYRASSTIAPMKRDYREDDQPEGDN
jgi:hypothetical protein